MAIARAPRQRAVSAAQLLLREHTPGLSVDGVWGPRTDRSYTTAPNTLQSRVELATAQLGFQVAQLRQNGEWISAQIADAMAISAAKKHGVPASAMIYLLRHEPSKRMTTQGLEYRVDSRSPGGSYYGLFQMGAKAWQDAFEIDPSIGPFSNWTDPIHNANAAAAFMKRNIGYARDKQYTGPFTDEVLYAMHNQGHSFITSARKGGYGQWYSSQSADAKRTLAAAAATVLRA